MAGSPRGPVSRRKVVSLKDQRAGEAGALARGSRASVTGCGGSAGWGSLGGGPCSPGVGPAAGEPPLGRHRGRVRHLLVPPAGCALGAPGSGTVEVPALWGLERGGGQGTLTQLCGWSEPGATVRWVSPGGGGVMWGCFEDGVHAARGWCRRVPPGRPVRRTSRHVIGRTDVFPRRPQSGVGSLLPINSARRRALALVGRGCCDFPGLPAMQWEPFWGRPDAVPGRARRPPRCGTLTRERRRAGDSGFPAAPGSAEAAVQTPGGTGRVRLCCQGQVLAALPT